MNIILFEPSETLAPLPARDPRAVHLLRVLRKKPGDSFDAGVLGGNLGVGRIEGAAGGELAFSLSLTEAPPPRHPLRMAVGFARPIQLKRLLRDLSSLGVEAIDLIATDLGEKSYQDTNFLRNGGALSSLIDGAAQARDTRTPALSLYPSLRAWLSPPFPPPPAPVREAPWNIYAGLVSAPAPAPPPLLIAADNARPQGAFPGLPLLAPGRGVIAAVGSERGWSDRERRLLEEAGFQRLSMGSRALRVETACAACAVLALEKMGALG